MKFAIMGSGGIGGYYGGRLAAAGNDVTFIARGRHLDAIVERGLKVKSELGDIHVRDAKATSNPADIGPADYVLFATKLYDTASAGKICRSLIGPNTAVISFQNGIEAADQLIEILGEQHVAGGVAHISAAIEEPGVIKHNGALARLTFGELDGRETDRMKQLRQATDEAGIETILIGDIEAELWRKFVFLAPMAAVTGILRAPMGSIRANKTASKLLEDAVRECVAVAKAKNIDLGNRAVEDALDLLSRFGPDVKASLAVDLDRGNRLELEWLSGSVHRLGLEFGVPTPVNSAAYLALKPFVDGPLAA